MIEAVTYKVKGKIFEFLIDKEVGRRLLSDAFGSAARLATKMAAKERPRGDDAEDDLARDRGSSSRGCSRPFNAGQRSPFHDDSSPESGAR